MVKHRKKELRKIIKLQYGLLDQLVSNGVCDLEQVKVIEDTECSTLYRRKILRELAEKLTSGSPHREQILEILKMNDQHHVAEFIENEGRKYRIIPLLTHVMISVYESCCLLLRLHHRLRKRPSEIKMKNTV